MIKCALGRLRPEPAMREAISGAVHAIQEVAVRGSLVANEVAHRALLDGTPWDAESFPKVEEQSWWRNVFSSCCRSSRTKDGAITRSRDALFGTDVSPRADMYLRANILSSLARDAVTNARLHVRDNFMRQLRKAFHREVTLHETVHGILPKGVRGELVERAVRHAIGHCHPLEEPDGAPQTLTARLRGLANTWRQRFPGVRIPVLDAIKEAPLGALMQWTFFLQRHMISCASRLASLLGGESDEAKARFGKSARMVRPLPLHDAKVKHICVDLSTLAEDLLPRSGRDVPEVARGKAKRSLGGLPDDPKSIRLWRERLWKASFPGVDRLLGRQKQDAFFLRTDGVSVSVAFRRGGASSERPLKRKRRDQPAPGAAEAPVLPRPEAFDRLVGIDPGRFLSPLTNCLQPAKHYAKLVRPDPYIPGTVLIQRTTAYAGPSIFDGTVMPSYVRKQHFGKKAYARDVTKRLTDLTLGVTNNFLCKFRAFAIELYPCSLQEEPDPPRIAAIRAFMHSFDSDTARKGALKSLQALVEKAGIHEVYIREAECALHESENLQLHFAEVIGAEPYSQDVSWLRRMFRSAVQDLWEIKRETNFEGIGDISLDDAICFLFKRSSSSSRCPNAVLRLRIATMVHFGFQMVPDMKAAIDRAQEVHPHFVAFRKATSFCPASLRFNTFFLLDGFYNMPPSQALSSMSPECIIERFSTWPSVDAVTRRYFSATAYILQLLKRDDAIKQLRARLSPDITQTPYLEWFAQQSRWHDQFSQTIMQHLREQHGRSHFSETQHSKLRYSLGTMLKFLPQYVLERHKQSTDDAVGPVHWFIYNCTPDEAVECTVAFVRSRDVRNERVKSTDVRHHAEDHIKVPRAFFDALQCITSVNYKVSSEDVLRQVTNRRLSSDGQSRRTFTTEEIDTMLNVASKDPRTHLLLTILREVGLRAGAIRHLTYNMLVDESHTPRHVARVPEKQQTWRCFVTSPGLKRAIKGYTESVRDQMQNMDGIYIFNVVNHRKPVNVNWVRNTLSAVAREARICDVQVHPHAFRHTIVGELIKAGNAMEAVSKYMGHKNVSTTANSYHVPTAEEIHEQIKNPFTGALQEEVRAEADSQHKIEALESKLRCAIRFITHQQSILKTAAAQELSAQEALTLFHQQTPYAEDVIKAIAATSSISTSSESAC